jgi:hypothetical protein
MAEAIDQSEGVEVREDFRRVIRNRGNAEENWRSAEVL